MLNDTIGNYWDGRFKCEISESYVLLFLLLTTFLPVIFHVLNVHGSMFVKYLACGFCVVSLGFCVGSQCSMNKKPDFDNGSLSYFPKHLELWLSSPFTVQIVCPQTEAVNHKPKFYRVDKSDFLVSLMFKVNCKLKVSWKSENFIFLLRKYLQVTNIVHFVGIHFLSSEFVSWFSAFLMVLAKQI